MEWLQTQKGPVARDRLRARESAAGAPRCAAASGWVDAVGPVGPTAWCFSVVPTACHSRGSVPRGDVPMGVQLGQRPAVSRSCAFCLTTAVVAEVRVRSARRVWLGAGA